MKKVSLLMCLVVWAGSMFAQSIDEGKKMLYYERFTSAQDIFNKILASDPNNTEAAYWLGQVYLQNSDNPDSLKAKELYQKTLQAQANDPLLMVGMGEIDLMEGRKDEARNKFETAKNVVKKRDRPAIQVEIARANVDTRNGDPMYAIQNLDEAADKDKKNAEIPLLRGDAYRKMIDGAKATVAYQEAFGMDPKLAKAPFMIGRIYETQGFGQEPIYMRYYDQAAAADPNYAPLFYWLYNYYYRRDVNKADEYLKKYIAVSDQDSKNCYAQASLLYVSQKYQEAITKSDECITAAAGGNVFPNLYGLKAYSYDKMGDSLNAKKYFEEFLAKVQPDKIGPNDYASYASILLKFPGNDSLAEVYVDKALALDTVPSSRLEYVKNIATSLAASQKFKEAGDWYTKILEVKPDYGKVDLYYAGYNEYRGGDYHMADSIFGLYMDKYPGDIFGAYMRARAVEGIDTTGELSLAKPYYQKVIEIADTTQDKASVKDKLIPAYRYMVANAYNINKDKETAIQYNDKILEVDPADETALKTKEALAPSAGGSSKTKTDDTKVKVTDDKVKVKSK